jgi:RNA polymerase sigma factor (sigma-70 family)
MSEGLTLGRSASRSAPALGLLRDDRLARLVAGGSTAAFTAIYKRHHQALYRYCLSIVGNEHDARDALQETMASALNALTGSEREIALKPWLFRIAHNEAVTVLRRKRRETPVDELAATAGDDGRETRDDLRELIDDLGLLTARQRSALVMRELNGLSFAEIGDALDVSPEAAKQAVYEGRCALRDLREGRALACAEVRKKISAEDRRLLRGRQVRAHLKACDSCREFAEEINQRRSSFAALAPLPAPAALGILQALLGGGSGGGGIAVGTGASLAGIAKLGIAGVIAVGVGAGAIEVRDHVRGDSSAAAEERVATPAAADSESTDASSVPVTNDAGPNSAAKASTHGGSAGKGDDGSEGGSSHSHAAGPGSANGAGGGGSTTTAEDADPASGATDETTVADTAEAVHDNNGNGPASTPPGHGGTPPGQGGNPPGLGAPAPGHGGTPPGQSTTDPPGNSENAPGQTGQTPSEGASPPGQAPDVPGNSGDAPGHSGSSSGHSSDG